MESKLIQKSKAKDLINNFIESIDSDEVIIEYSENQFILQKVRADSVLDELISKADDLGPDDLSKNIDHYLYGLPKKEKK